MRLTDTHWSESEEAILVHRREGDSWSFRKIAAELPLRTTSACQQQYKIITGRRLKPSEWAKLVGLWETYLSPLPHY